MNDKFVIAISNVSYLRFLFPIVRRRRLQELMVHKQFELTIHDEIFLLFQLPECFTHLVDLNVAIRTVSDWAGTNKMWICSFVWRNWNWKKKNSNEIQHTYTGRNDWSHRVPRWTCHGLCPNGYTRYQKSTKISKQSSPGKLFHEQFINKFFFCLFFPNHIPIPRISYEHFNLFFFIFIHQFRSLKKKIPFHSHFLVWITFGFSFLIFITFPFTFSVSLIII